MAIYSHLYLFLQKYIPHQKRPIITFFEMKTLFHNQKILHPTKCENRENYSCLTHNRNTISVKPAHFRLAQLPECIRRCKTQEQSRLKTKHCRKKGTGRKMSCKRQNF